ncbi:DUF6973 domain-containing protein [Nocardia thailandica]
MTSDAQAADVLYTVSRAQTLDLSALTLQADLWQSQAQAISRTMTSQKNSVDGSQDFWQGSSGSGFRSAFLPLDQNGTDLQTSLTNGTEAARTAQQKMAAAKSAVDAAVQAAKQSGLEVADDGTCTLSQKSRIALLTSASDTTQLATGQSSLQQEADYHTQAVQQALAQLSTEDTTGRRAIENAFADLQVEKTQDLGKHETFVCVDYPAYCANAKRRGVETVPWDESEKYFPDSEGYNGVDDRRDACRHCIWMGMMTAWASEDFARDMAQAHEQDSPSSDDPTYAAASAKMDYYNNETGIAVGLRHDDDTEGIINECVTIARNAKKVNMSDIPNSSANTSKNGLIFFNGPA